MNHGSDEGNCPQWAITMLSSEAQDHLAQLAIDRSSKQSVELEPLKNDNQ
jgi:hypothetical protein